MVYTEDIKSAAILGAPALTTVTFSHSCKSLTWSYIKSVVWSSAKYTGSLAAIGIALLGYMANCNSSRTRWTLNMLDVNAPTLARHVWQVSTIQRPKAFGGRRTNYAVRKELWRCIRQASAHAFGAIQTTQFQFKPNTEQTPFSLRSQSHSHNVRLQV